MPSALWLEHVPHEPLAGFAQPLEAAGYRLAKATPDALAALDWLAPDLMLVMGGPMGVYERDRHAWIEPEIAGLRARLAAKRPTLGICLGSQMIAAALGAEVRPGPVREVGFAPVALTMEGEGSPLRHLAGVPVLHWHGDTFDLPEGTEHLAASRAYPNQAFRIGDWLLALQFHAEMGEDPVLGTWIERNGDYIASAGTTPEALRDQWARHGTATVAAGRAMLAEWLAGL